MSEGKINVTLDFLTDNNVNVLNDLFVTMEHVTKRPGVLLYSDDKCGNNGGLGKQSNFMKVHEYGERCFIFWECERFHLFVFCSSSKKCHIMLSY